MNVLPFALFLASALACQPDSLPQSVLPPVEGLKKVFSGDFLIGAALNEPQILRQHTSPDQLIVREFNSLTAENCMKSVHIHPSWSDYRFELPDKLVAFAQAHQMKLIGHTLVWHSQLAPFVHTISTRDSMDLFLKEHISTIAGHFKGKVAGWDVVNEALEEDGSLRKNVFYEKMGESYIAKSFQCAEQAAPDAELYYNDYNLEQPAKRAGAIALIKKLRTQGVRIDGVGIQGHWSVHTLDLNAVEESILAYSALGLKVMFTELDLTVLPNPWDLKGADVNQNYEGSPFMNPFPTGLPAAELQLQAEKYKALFAIFLKHADKIDRITFWGVGDGDSWLNDWPIKNRTNYPLLFDRSYQPKPAYFQILALKN